MANWPETQPDGFHPTTARSRPGDAAHHHPHNLHDHRAHPDQPQPSLSVAPDSIGRENPASAGRINSRFWRWPNGLAQCRRLFAATAGIGLTFLLLIVSVVTYHAIHLPTPSLADLRRQTTSIHIVDANGRTLARRGERLKFLKTEQIPNHLISAVLATEDRRFVNHIGIDVIGLTRAMLRNIRAGRYIEGGSTITQQLAKNVFLKPRRTMSRKIQELILAFWLEVRLSKKQILELYLNRVYFGSGAYGIEAAANRYFGKPAQNLTLGESAVLAGLLKAPSRYSPQRDPAVTLRRARIVLQNMIVTGAIKQEQALAVVKRPIHFVTSRPRKRMRYTNYAIDQVYEQLAEKIGEPAGNIVVQTTIDRDLQVHTQKLVADNLSIEARIRKADEAAVVVLDQNGAIKALVGGRSYQISQFNRAVKARRQPGSAFKPFVYTAAIEGGFTPDTIAYDEPITIKDWTPRNYAKKHRGPVTLRNALAHSINTVAVRIFLEIGRKEVVKIAERLGIRSRLHTLPSLALGTAEVTPLELTNAYVPF
ncbi:MAG: transglycosylase domain-containing protein, partial [Hyphomicrobiaceae bacterium]